MLKTKQRRFAIVAVLLFSLITMYGGTPAANADSMDSAKVTLGDSEPSAENTITVVFNLGEDLDAADDYITVAFAAEFSGIAQGNVTCPGGNTASVSGNDVTCTSDVATIASTSDQTITITNVTNPGAANPYSVDLTSYHVGAVEIESTETLVYIIEDVTVTAHVAASLTFAVAGTTTAAVVNGDSTTGGSTATELAYGTLTKDTEQILAQTLTVQTNASAGYTVTVQQDQDMTSAGGADINAFNTGGPVTWASPAGTLSDNTTYGHMGVASDDSDLATSFNAGFYQGLNGTTPLEVMSHDGPADGTTQDAGIARVAYNIEITGLQEAGDYENTLTYICTPTY